MFNDFIMSLKREFINTYTLKEIFIFFICVPSFLTVVFFSSLNETFALYTAKPSLITVYFSNFAHSNLNHFCNNITFYIVIFGFIFVFNKLLKIRIKKEFYFDMVFIFLVVPCIVSLYNIWSYPNNSTNAFLGFSGINSALNGYLSALFIVFIYNKAGLKLRNFYAFISIIYFNLIILGLFVYDVKTEWILVLTVLTFISLVFIKKDLNQIISLLKNYRNEISNVKIFYILLFLLFILFICVAVIIVMFWISMFPSAIVSENGNRINIEGHYLGYCTGILTPWTIYNIRKHFCMQ